MKDPLVNKKVYTSVMDNLNVKPLFKSLKWGNKREDYTLLRNFEGTEVQQEVCNDKISYKGKVFDLSDHYGILTTIDL